MNESSTVSAQYILVVEDSATQAFKLRHLLLRHFPAVTTVSNGVEALAMIESAKPSLIVSDVVMPEMDGHELSRRVKTDPRLADIPFILITALSEPSEAIKGLQCGADGFLTKPYDEEHLVSRLKFFLAGPRSHPPLEAFQPEACVEIEFGGKKYFIASERGRILDLLLSTYDLAIWKNREARAMREKYEVQTRELQRSNRELEQFASVASHDLQEPLRMITSYLTLLERRLGDRLDEKEKSFFKFAVDGGLRMRQMITDMLDYARAGTRDPDPPLIALDPLLEGALANLRATIDEKHARVTHDPLPPLKVVGPRFAQLFQNLVGNALKFSDPSRPPEIHIGCTEKFVEWHFFVRDNGIGLPAKDFDRVFLLFQRLHTREEYPGTGIGLSLCQKIVESHGGRIWIESEEGKGTTVHFTVPVGA